MDVILTKFVTLTDIDPSLARNFLEGNSWDLNQALEAYSRMGDTRERNSHPTNPSTTNSIKNNNVFLTNHRSTPINIVHRPSNRSYFSEQARDRSKSTHVIYNTHTSDHNMNGDSRTNHSYADHQTLFQLRQKTNATKINADTNSSCIPGMIIPPEACNAPKWYTKDEPNNGNQFQIDIDEDDEIERVKRSTKHETPHFEISNDFKDNQTNSESNGNAIEETTDSKKHFGPLSKCDSEPSLLSQTNSDSTMNSHENVNMVGIADGDITDRNSPSSSVNSSPSKLAIPKDEDFKNNLELPKKLTRGISRATNNVNLVSKARNEFAANFRTSNRGSRVIFMDSLGLETPDFTFTLPDLSIHPEDFKKFLEQDLIEKSTLVSLEQCGRLNWWSDPGACQKLLPLATSGDGNCLLHAASLGIWGFHDRLLTLRKALHAILQSKDYSDSFYRRWRWQTFMQNKEAGLVYCEEEWNKEWNLLLKMASTQPRLRTNGEDKEDVVAPLSSSKSNLVQGGRKKLEQSENDIQPHVYESLEELHILALAHVLKRPIIVIADTMLKDVTGEPFAPIPFGGIYLPVDCHPHECHRAPLCLAYDAAHFSALVSMDSMSFVDKSNNPPAVIPLVDPEHKLLPLQFVVDPGVNVKWGEDENESHFIEKVTLTDREKLCLLKEYLDVVHVTIPNTVGDEVSVETPSYHLAYPEEPDEPLAIPEPTSSQHKISVQTQTSDLDLKSYTLPHSFSPGDLVKSSFSGPTSSEITQHKSTESASISATDLKFDEKGTMTKQERSSRALRRWQSFARHFGSLGRSMSRQFKKPFNTLKRGTSFRKYRQRSKNNENLDKPVPPSPATLKEMAEQKRAEFEKNYITNHIPNSVLVTAVLHLERRHEYHDEMIRNYLTTARVRFLSKC